MSGKYVGTRVFVIIQQYLMTQVILYVYKFIWIF